MRTAWRAALLVTLTLVFVTNEARAGDFDLKLSRLCEIETTTGQRVDCGGGYTPRLGAVRNVIADNASFRALMSELGVLFAPNVLAPAETFGWGGFTFAAEFGFTTLNPKKNVVNVVRDGNGERSREACYWRAAESVRDSAFVGGINNTLVEQNLPSPIAPTITLMARKGLWLPVPSFELGVGVRHLLGSRMWAAIAQAKVSIHEGFQGLPLPAFSIRGMGSRVFNTPGFNLTLAGLDFSISKHFGIASTFNIMPYVGYQLIWIIADSGVIDATPNVDAISETLKADPKSLNVCKHSDCNANFTFDDQADILRHRFFIGIRMNFYIVSFLLEYTYFAAGREADNVFEAIGTSREVRDQSGEQHGINFAIALDY